MRTAAIGIGSNSLRMLVADVEAGLLHRIQRYRAGLRVFAALDEQGNIKPEMLADACRSVREFQLEAEQAGAERIHLFATSAVRDASNQDAFSRALFEATGLELDICSGDTEASLSFWGAAEEHPCGLIDIGGGSTEIAIGYQQRIDCAFSLQMGAVRLYRMKPIFSLDQAREVEKIASDILSEHLHTLAVHKPNEWIGVGGTFTTCASLIQQTPWENRTHIHGYRITLEALENAIAFLAPMPMEERLKLPCLQPQRADIVVHGMTILSACMKRMNIPSIVVSECGNLEGYLKAKYIFNAKI